jgi:hypothetical protein
MSLEITQAKDGPHGALAATETDGADIEAESTYLPGVKPVMDVNIKPVTDPTKTERLAVAMGFKMPVAEYVMVEFRVERVTHHAPGDEDAAFEENKKWVEDKINGLVSEQLNAGK